MSIWNGRMRLAVTPCAAILALAALVCAPAALRAKDPKAGGEIDADSAKVTGRAMAVDGSGVAGVKVELTLPRMGRSGQREEVLGEIVTDANGWFEVLVSPALAEEIRSSTWRPELQVDVQTAREEALAPAAVRTQVNRGRSADPNLPLATVGILMVPATGKIGGQVLGDGNEPVAGASVYLTLANCLNHKAVTDGAGHYEFTHLAYGTYNITEVVPPAGSAMITLRPSYPRAWGEATVALGEGAAQVKDFHLNKGSRIIGRVLAAGRPVEGAAVACGLDAASDSGGRVYPRGPGYDVSAKTDANGIYLLGGLSSETYKVRMGPPPGSGLAGALVREVTVGSDGGDVPLQDVDLQGGGRLIVTARYANGKPAAGVTLYCEGASAAAGANGRVEFAGLESGAHELTAGEGRDFGQRLGEAKVVAGLTVEQTVTVPAAKKEPKPAPPARSRPANAAVVAGVVSDPNGAPLARCKVMLVQGTRQVSSSLAEGETDANGQYEMWTTQGGTAQVLAGPPAGANLLPAETFQAFNSGERTTVNVSLKAGCALAGNVGQGGKGAPWATIWIQCPDLYVGMTWMLNNTGTAAAGIRTRLDGNYRVAGLAPGKYEVQVVPLDPQYCPAKMMVIIAGPGEQTLDVALQRTGSLTGTITDESGVAISSQEASVSLVGEDTGRRGLGGRGISIRPAGRIDAAMVPPAKYSLTVYIHPAGTKAGLGKVDPVEVTIEEGKKAEVKVVVPRAVTTAPAGKPVDKAMPAEGGPKLAG